jgi:hypothetical protein
MGPLAVAQLPHKWSMVACNKRSTSVYMQEREGNGALPLEGSIPDMTATTDMYLTLQRIYRAKADEHCQSVLAHAVAIASGCGRSTDDVTMEKVKLYCRNARHLTVVRPLRIPGSAADLNAATLRKVCHSQSLVQSMKDMLPLSGLACVELAMDMRRPLICRRCRTMRHGMKASYS